MATTDTNKTGKQIPGYKKGQPDVKWWQAELKLAIEHRDKVTHKSQWKKWEEMYRGNWPNPNLKTLNLFFMMARTMIPRVYFRNPAIAISPTKPNPLNLAMAIITQRMDNKLLKTMKMKSYMKRLTQYIWFYGTAGIKVGFGSEFVGSPSFLEDDLSGNVTQNKMSWKTEYRDNLTPFMPFVQPIHTGNLVIPAGYTEQEALPWRAHIVVRSIDEIRVDTRFHPSRKDVGPNSEQLRNEKTQIQYVQLAEIHDVRTGKVIVIPLEGGDPEHALLFSDDFLQYANTNPIFLGVHNEDPMEVWGVSDSHILHPFQDEMNEIRTLKAYHRRLAIFKILYEEGAIEEDQLQKLLTFSDSPGVKVKDLLGIELREQVADIPQALWAEDERVMQDVREGQGFSRNQFGDYNSGSGDTTATEATIVRMASELRIDERRDIQADLLVDVMNSVNRIVFNLWREEQVIDVVGPGGLPLYIAFRPSMLKDTRFELSADPDSMMPETKQQKMQQAAMDYQLLRDNPIINPVALTSSYLRATGKVDFENMLMKLDLGSGGLDPNRPLDINDFGRVLNAQQGDNSRANPTEPRGRSNSLAGPSSAGNGESNMGGIPNVPQG